MISIYLKDLRKTSRNKDVKTKIILSLILVFFILVSSVSIRFYSYVFARHITGKIVAIDRVTQPSAIMSSGSPIPASQIFSFAVAIQDKAGEIVTASSEDRQWAVVEKGQCAEAKFFPYPFWQLDKAGTYFGARLLKLYECNAE
jgi:hypothetical protein